LQFAEREEIALLRAQGHGVREIARRLERTASTISSSSKLGSGSGLHVV
jgi:IS30 family transposase